jgi:hypothetical protein
MMGKAMAIIAAALCAGFFASAVLDTGPDVAAGPVEDSGLVVPNIVTMDRFAALWTPTAAAFHGLIERHHANYSWDHKVAHSEGWPYCDPACWRGGRGADSAHVGAVPTIGQSAAGTSETAINRIRKGDRLTKKLFAKQYPSFPSSFESALPSSKPILLGCDPAFSSVADPARSHIYGRCMA